MSAGQGKFHALVWEEKRVFSDSGEEGWSAFVSEAFSEDPFVAMNEAIVSMAENLIQPPEDRIFVLRVSSKKAKEGGEE